MDIYGVKDISNQELYQSVLEKYGFTPESKVTMLPFAGAIGKEIRHLYFQLAVGNDGLFREEPVLTEVHGKILHSLQVTRLFSFGTCNAACPYCKRDMQFMGDDGEPIASIEVPIELLFKMAEGAVSRGEVVRFSGGDPVLWAKACYAISEYVLGIGGKGTSIAHNGSGPNFVEKLLPFMSSAAVDIKAPKRYMGVVLGLSQKLGETHFENSFKTQRLFHENTKNTNNALLDVRTPVFGYHENPEVPQTTLEDMMQLGALIVANNDPRKTFWTWRLYKPVHGCDWNAPIVGDVLQMMQKVSEAYPKQWMGIRAKWHGGGMIYFYGGKAVNLEDKFDVYEPKGSGNTGECITK